jgi:nitroreductase
MNDTLKTIDNRRSLRGYAPEQISEEHRRAIIHSAFRAPTAGNMMHYSIIEVTDQKAKDRLVETCDNQPLIGKAPLVLLFLADMQRWYDLFEYSAVPDMCKERGLEYVTPKEGDLMLAACDALIAAQNAVIAAESLGIGSCYIGDIMEHIEVHREMFNLPRWVFPITLLCFGYPQREDREERAKTPRFSERFILFKDKYRHVDIKEFEAEFVDRFKDRKDLFKDAPNIGQLLFLRKTGSTYANELRRSVKVALEDWK